MKIIKEQADRQSSDRLRVCEQSATPDVVPEDLALGGHKDAPPRLLDIVHSTGVATRNILLAGSSGTGKTQAAKLTLRQELQQDPPLKIVVLDNKDEYGDFVAESDGVAVDVTQDGLPFNPLVPGTGTPVDVHVEGFLANFQASTGMGALQLDQLRDFLTRCAINRVPLSQVPALMRQR